MSLLQDFIRRVEGFLDRHEMPATRFGKLAVNDPSLVFELRQGRKPNPDLIDKIDGFMSGFEAAPKRGKRGSDRRQLART